MDVLRGFLDLCGVGFRGRVDGWGWVVFVKGGLWWVLLLSVDALGWVWLCLHLGKWVLVGWFWRVGGGTWVWVGLVLAWILLFDRWLMGDCGSCIP